MCARVRAQGPGREPREGLCEVRTAVLHGPRRDPGEASLGEGLAMAFLFAGDVGNAIRPRPAFRSFPSVTLSK